ncbi:MAG: ABC transporter, partial [Ottowia sp.]|nr:ABC transporter [Ottowia sp.]
AAQTAPLKKRLAAVETRMGAIAARTSELHEQLAAPMSADERAAAGRELKALETENAALENEWLQLGEKIEAIEHGNQTP